MTWLNTFKEGMAYEILAYHNGDVIGHINERAAKWHASTKQITIDSYLSSVRFTCTPISYKIREGDKFIFCDDGDVFTTEVRTFTVCRGVWE